MKYKIIVDKQPSTNPTSEKRTYEIDIEELRVKGDVYDSLIITKDEAYVMRRLSLSEYHVLSVLENEVKEPLTDLDITLFEGDNYIYLMDLTGNKFYAEYLVKNDFNDIFCTRNEMNSAIVQSANQIELNVNQKLLGYSTTEEMNAAIRLSAEGIESEVSKKVGDDEIISKINQSAEAVTIQANKVNLNGFVTVTDLKTGGSTVINGSNITTGTIDASKVIVQNLNADNIKSGTIDASKITVQNLNADNIKSGTITGRSISGGTISGAKITNGNNFSVDASGNMSCSNASITGGNINLSGVTDSAPKLKISGTGRNGYSATNITNADGFRVETSDGKGTASLSIARGTSGPSPQLYLADDNYNTVALVNTGMTLADENGKTTTILARGITTPTVNQTSLASQKKNFEKLENALEILKNIDIYKYNFKDEDDKTKKHIGFVIGENYKYREEVTSNENNGVDLYSFVSLCCKAIQEQQEKIDKLEERLEALENG